MFLAVSILIDLTELKLDLIFDVSIWESIKVSKISSTDISNEFKIEKDRLNDYMHKYIFDKNNYQTTTRNLMKTINGYTFSSECKKQESRWTLRINVSDKSAHLNFQLMRNHIKIPSNQSKPGHLLLKFLNLNIEFFKLLLFPYRSFNSYKFN